MCLTCWVRALCVWHAGLLALCPEVSCQLRSAEAAKVSEIRQDASTPGGIRKLLAAFQSQGPHVLLFLKSVRKISLWTRDGQEAAPQLLHTITAVTQVSLAELPISPENPETGERGDRRWRVSAAQVPHPCPRRCLLLWTPLLLGPGVQRCRQFSLLPSS